LSESSEKRLIVTLARLSSVLLLLSVSTWTTVAQQASKRPFRFTPAECVPVMTRAVYVAFMGGGAPPEGRKVRDFVFETKYRQLVFEKMALRETKTDLDAAWQRISPDEQTIKISDQCVDLYSSLRQAGRIDLLEENDAINEARKWTQSNVPSHIEK
jgi:hypothetical protein